MHPSNLGVTLIHPDPRRLRATLEAIFNLTLRGLRVKGDDRNAPSSCHIFWRPERRLGRSSSLRRQTRCSWLSPTSGPNRKANSSCCLGPTEWYAFSVERAGYSLILVWPQVCYYQHFYAISQLPFLYYPYLRFPVNYIARELFFLLHYPNPYLVS